MKRSKYRAVATTVDGIRFASKREARRYGELRLLERAGTIKALGLQPRFHIVLNGIEICEYVADFVYEEGGKRIVEDAKGFRTPVYRLKKKLAEAQFGIVVRET